MTDSSISICGFCECPEGCYEEEYHRCLAESTGCGCGEDCPIRVEKCGCVQCYGEKEVA